MRRLAVAAGVLVGCVPGAIVALTSGGRGSGSRPPVLVAAGHRAAGAALVPDPEAAQSYPQPAWAPRHALAKPPAAAATHAVAPGAPTDAEIRQELRQMRAAVGGQQNSVGVPQAGAGSAASSTQLPGAYVLPRGNARPPRGAPLAVARVIAAGNAIANFPYIWGGGHASFVDNGYDCSGSVSYALAGAGLLGAPLTSGELMSWGVPGPGKWISVYANAGHTYMYVAGLRFDTSGRSGPFGSRWQAAARDNSGFVVRHWPGL